MNLLEQTVVAIHVPDTELSSAVDAALSAQTSTDFGHLRSILLRYMNITGERHPAPPQTSVIISCADHGVAAESVSAYPPETTLNMMCNYLIARGGAANAAANYAGARLVVADLGVNAAYDDIPGLLQHSIARGTANMTKGSAMTRAQAIAAIETGIVLANDCADRGDRCILPGEMGISNTTSSAAIVAAFLGLTPEEVTGRGANISDARLAHKIEIVRRALSVNRPDPHDGLDVLAKVGGFELGCIAGIILGAAARHMLVILDGANTTSAALIAHALAPDCAHYLLASHASLTEHSHPHALRRLGLTPILRLDIRLSEAAGSSIALRLLERMLKIWEAVDAPSHNAMPPPCDTGEGNRAAVEGALLPVSPPQHASMDACQYRLDNLAKPIHSLGYLERIAVQLAGILGTERPPIDTKAALLLITDRELPADLAYILNTLTASASIPVHIFTVSQVIKDTRTAYETAYALARTYPILILGAYEREESTAVSAALTGALHGAAAGASLILPGDARTDRAARTAADENAALRPYILHILPDMLMIDTELTAGIAGILGIEIVRAALHVVNEMKTFTETGVAVAIDGAGAGRQVNT
ncbi:MULTISPECIES: nicotinate-nucleotide--dimethylbenzimidazole phosphoribosyltransferase [Selenomonas]|uniref:Nicotinate-nucleotide--dimethylbenzimidazole phosphoribosyltransferase n=1 Tax=Selenomonas timonae TaxID=2754044 RepID=A0A7G7VHV3_9FIRM|nr:MULTISPECIES: nicotinate-nucleotide--dimethylbenzimidazole phosphoribosyltransferase [Selenomonas]EKY01889.1 putative nicotinate-nucleotide--dimethylbenzimidazole phosphoribosyltransferase [Selenomonas sp. oral taxon 138 str. F0429]QNH53696.1 nicotinate-nucleotide--dimethylbenzimidazole phosphoribosyltransferase [Selenomonas timonae]